MTRRFRHDPPADPITTIGQMMSEAPRWFHITCNTIGCRNRAAVPLVPLILRWGPHAPREWLDTRFRCTRCGARSTTVTRPSVAPFGVIEEFPANLALPIEKSE